MTYGNNVERTRSYTWLIIKYGCPLTVSLIVIIHLFYIIDNLFTDRLTGFKFDTVMSVPVAEIKLVSPALGLNNSFNLISAMHVSTSPISPDANKFIIYYGSTCSSEIFCDGKLLDTVQRAQLFSDSKTFVDMHLNTDPEIVLADFQSLPPDASNEEVKAFVMKYFSGPGEELESWTPSDWVPSPKLLKKIGNLKLRHWASELNGMWKTLGKKLLPGVAERPEFHSFLYVPNPFIIPGDRFREFYYWDSYWIVGGLLLSDMVETARGMIENFFFLVNKYGMVPNGGRVYYTRSQPPLLTPMVGLYYAHTGDLEFVRSHIATLEREYVFWEVNRTLPVTCPTTGDVHRLSQYIVHMTQPRPEGYMPDLEQTAAMSEADAVRTLSNKAAACESGWDFSSRWFSDYSDPDKIDTSNIIPVDLNVFLCITEQQLATFHSLLGNQDKEAWFRKLADDRKNAMDALLWNEEKGVWFDLDLATMTHREKFFPSNIFPLFGKCTNMDLEAVGDKVVNYVKESDVMRYPGGIPSSLDTTGEQWDFPNAWPPLVHLFVESLATLTNPEAQNLAQKAAHTWISSNFMGWKRDGHMYEKYDARQAGRRGAGGEYEVQIGFGWTNGAILMLLDKYPDVSDTSPPS